MGNLNSIHIAIFIPSFRGGGAERAMINLANGLVDIPMDTGGSARVSLLVLDERGCYRSEVNARVRIHSLQTLRASRSLYSLVKHYNQNQPDVVISTLTHLNILAILARVFARVKPKIMVTERNTYSEFHARETVVDHVMHALVGPCYRRADAVVAVSCGVAADLRKTFSFPCGDVKTIYNPVISEGIRSLSELDPHSLLPKINFEEKFILAVGSLEYRKGFDVLIQAFCQLAEKHNRVTLVILGEGPLRRELEEMIVLLGLEHRVVLAGFVPNPFAIMRRAVVFVLCSRVEGLPNVLIQAMACGTQVISTDCPSGPREILENGKWGRLVPVEDQNALAMAIDEVLSQQAQKYPVEERAKYFSVERAVRSYQNLIDELLGAAS